MESQPDTYDIGDKFVLHITSSGFNIEANGIDFSGFCAQAGRLALQLGFVDPGLAGMATAKSSDDIMRAAQPIPWAHDFWPHCFQMPSSGPTMVVGPKVEARAIETFLPPPNFRPEEPDVKATCNETQRPYLMTSNTEAPQLDVENDGHINDPEPTKLEPAAGTDSPSIGESIQIEHQPELPLQPTWPACFGDGGTDGNIGIDPFELPRPADPGAQWGGSSRSGSSCQEYGCRMKCSNVEEQMTCSTSDEPWNGDDSDRQEADKDDDLPDECATMDWPIRNDHDHDFVEASGQVELALKALDPLRGQIPYADFQALTQHAIRNAAEANKLPVDAFTSAVEKPNAWRFETKSRWKIGEMS